MTDLLRPPFVSFDPSEQSSALKGGAIHILGFEFDGTACFRKGARNGPDAIRNASPHIETYSPYLDQDVEDVSLIDLGNLAMAGLDGAEQNWQTATDAFFQLTEKRSLAAEKIKFLVLGGEHSISYAPIKIYLDNYPELTVLHLDAHADLRDGYQGYKYSHASIIRRIVDHFGQAHRLIQYGIRSGTREEYEWMAQHGTRRTSLQSFLEDVQSIDPVKPIYLTLDLDFFDPAFLPGTGTPEAGGEDFGAFIKLVKILRKKNLVGADVVELAPDIDPTGNSSVFAAKVVRELILAMS